MMKNSLLKYNQKRDFLKTNEPKGKKSESGKKLRFVVQHHLASKDHFDLRLEYNNVLKSWAVPKGPSYNPQDKRLAILVEDHPITYRNFEGVIPKGQYGGGTVMIFDEGYYEMLNNFQSGFKKGLLKFKLYGKRLKGTWSLVHFKENNYLLIKDEDSYFEFSDITKIKTSIKTGRTMEEINQNIKIKKNALIENVKITSPDKLIYDKEKITKKDVINYYQKVSKRMLPFLNNRILSTVRCPEGINKNIFFKKHFENENEGLSKINLLNKKHEKEDYYYITNIYGLINEAQMNGIEFHIWGAKVNDLNHPDIMVFDLDPDEKLSLSVLRKGVSDLKRILDELNLKAYLKTSGGKGYHILVPIKNVTWAKFQKISKDIAVLMETKWPDKYTSSIQKKQRKGKIFIDYMRNIKGSTSICPYSLRARKNAPVSMPISWDDLEKIKPDEIKLKDA